MKWMNRSFTLLLQGQFVTHLGSQIYDVAMLLWLKQLTQSPALMGLALLLSNLPEALLAPLGGRIADRAGKVRTMVGADLVGGLVVGSVALLVWVDPGPAWMIAALCLGNVVLGVAASCFIPAVDSLVPLLIPGEHLERGNAVHRFCSTGARMLGQGLGGLVFAAMGAAGAFLLNALSFLGSALSEAFIRVPKESAAAGGEGDAPTRATLGEARGLLAETWKSLRFVWQSRDLRLLLLFIAAFHLCLSTLPISLPFYVENVLKIEGRWFGFFIAAYTLGIMAGFVIAGTLKPTTDRFKRIATVSVAVGGLFGLTAVPGTPWVAFAALVGIGTGIGVIVVNLLTELQLRAPAGETGSIMGAAHAVGGASLPLGMAATGLLLQLLDGVGLPYAVSVRLLLAASAVASVSLGLHALCSRRSAADSRNK